MKGPEAKPKKVKQHTAVEKRILAPALPVDEGQRSSSSTVGEPHGNGSSRKVFAVCLLVTVMIALFRVSGGGVESWQASTPVSGASQQTAEDPPSLVGGGADDDDDNEVKRAEVRRRRQQRPTAAGSLHDSGYDDNVVTGGAAGDAVAVVSSSLDIIEPPTLTTRMAGGGNGDEFTKTPPSPSAQGASDGDGMLAVPPPTGGSDGSALEQPQFGCSLRWHEQQFVGWDRGLRDGLKENSRTASKTSLCAPIAGSSGGCEWLLPTEEVARRRDALERLDVGILNVSAMPADASLSEFLQSRVISTSKPSVDIRTQMGEVLNTIKVSGISDPVGAAALSSCTLPYVDPRVCAKDTSILFIGHSHTRFLASMHCMMVGGVACSRYDKHDNDYVLVTKDEGAEVVEGAGGGTGSNTTAAAKSSSDAGSAASSPIRSLYIQANLDAVHRLKFVEKALREFIGRAKAKEEEEGKALSAPKQVTRAYFEEALRQPSSPPSLDTDGTVGFHNNPKFQSLFTHIVISKGAWETFLFERTPNATATELVEGLEALHGMFPRAKIILHMMHGYVPNKELTKKASKTKRARQEWRNVCYARDRIERIRIATLCGLERYILSNQQQASHRKGDGGPQIEVFDTVAETLDPHAAKFADVLGHHFTDGALEAIVQKLLLNHVCPLSSKGSAPHPSDSSSQIAFLRRFIANAVPSIDPAKRGAIKSAAGGVAKGAYPTIGEAYGGGSGGGGIFAPAQSIVCPLVDEWTRDFKAEPRCGCLRQKYSSATPFCGAMAGHLPKRSRLGDQKDTMDD